MIRQLKKKVLNFLEIYHFLLFKKKPKEKSKILILGKSKKLFDKSKCFEWNNFDSFISNKRLIYKNPKYIYIK